MNENKIVCTFTLHLNDPKPHLSCLLLQCLPALHLKADVGKRRPRLFVLTINKDLKRYATTNIIQPGGKIPVDTEEFDGKFFFAKKL